MARNNSPALAAGGSIYPSRFVKLSASNTGIQATANSETIGVSGAGVIDTREDVGNAYHATTTYPNNLELFALGDVCLLEAGTGGWSAGDLLEADSNGKGVVANGPGRKIGAVAIESANAGDKKRVQIVKHRTGGDGPISVASASGAISVKEGSLYITKTGSAAALTLDPPTATTDDGKRLTIFTTTAYAHTVTLPVSTAGFDSSGASADVATFSAILQGSMTIEAYLGVWRVVNLLNVTLG